MEQVGQIEFLIDKDIFSLPEEERTKVLKEEFEKHSYIPTDEPVVVREGKISSIRAVEKDTQEEVELYVFAKVIKKGDTQKTYISAKVV